MSGRRIVLLGLLCGMATAIAAGAVVVALAPDVTTPTTAQASPAPTVGPAVSAPASASASAPPSTSASPSPSAGSSPSAAPSGLPPPSAASSSSASASAPASASAASGSPPALSAASAVLVGRPAPTLRVRQLGGGLIDLAELRGYPVWIEFLKTCSSCADQLPLMGQLGTRYAGDGLKVVAVDMGDDEASVAALASSDAIDFPVGLDADGAAGRAWGVADVPIHFFVDASGVVRDVVAGGSGTAPLVAGLAKVMPGVAVAP